MALYSKSEFERTGELRAPVRRLHDIEPEPRDRRRCNLLNHVRRVLWNGVGRFVSGEAAALVETTVIFVSAAAALLLALPGLTLLGWNDLPTLWVLSRHQLLSAWATAFGACAGLLAWARMRDDTRLRYFASTGLFSLWLGLTVAVYVIPIYSFALIYCPVTMWWSAWVSRRHFMARLATQSPEGTP